MTKFMVAAIVAAFAVGILVGLSTRSESAALGGQVLNSAIPAQSDVAQLEDSDPSRMTSLDKLDAQVALLNILQASLIERNVEYEELIAEIERLTTIKATLEEELAETAFVPGRPLGQ